MAFLARIANVVAALAAPLMLTACADGSPLTTSALFGGNSAPPPAPVVAEVTPNARAMQVGTTSARALKCGFNFDPVKLRTQFLAAEAATDPQAATQVAQIYDSAFSGVKKAVAAQSENYCSSRKTTQIKEALTRHLAGDFAPPPPEPAAVEEGFLSSSSGSGSSTEGNSKFQKPMAEW